MRMQPTHVYEVRPRKDDRGVDLISDALPFGRLWYGKPNAISNAIGYAMHRSRSHHAVIRVYDTAGQRDRDAGARGRVQRGFCDAAREAARAGGAESGYYLINSRASSAILFASSIQFLLINSC